MKMCSSPHNYYKLPRRPAGAWRGMHVYCSSTS
uniref:Uncharacterized protein n=1 Tax=Anguilla anguilla TaxID=7936 RepID=A0A0E9RV68_ANGAN